MFTGIIQTIGDIADTEHHGEDLRMRIGTGSIDAQALPVGSSIAVNGVCLTATETAADYFVADLSPETLQVTSLGQIRQGAPVNIEPAMRMGDALDGHLVTGHIDGVGKVSSLEEDGRAWRLAIELPADLARYVARKGSVAVDGVSLTVNSVDGIEFAVAIVPHTLSATIIQHYAVGTAVNIEVDLIARYLERLSEFSR